MVLFKVVSRDAETGVARGAPRILAVELTLFQPGGALCVEIGFYVDIS